MRRVRVLTARLGSEDLGSLVRATHERGLWGEFLPLVELMDDSAKQRIFDLPAFQDQAGS
ncbi:hypothetical protein [Streptomyces sp. G-G2]|uniref:hypothetical protein n=1 Tax=Streptomyces sp. G-G2 TaxID=3046201 RepID=UPI0024BAC329|nr:hypothetical protein [Streptomyces sp. G-G2]MDJ0384351.1 hypothetical protein [Streptomyces sp. G-G2]